MDDLVGAVPIRAQLLSAGVDYVTLTSESEKAWRLLAHKFMVWSKQMAVIGHEVKPWKALGYDGLACANVSVGEGPNGYVTRGTGALAEAWWQRAAGDEWRASRIDLQVTAKFETDVPDFARMCREGAVHERKMVRGGRPRNITYIDGCGSGDTLNVGSRASSKFGRLYDKYREDSESYEPGTWRWEVEYKAEMGAEMERSLRAEPLSMGVASAYVRGYFETRGVMFPVDVDVAPIDVSLGHVQTDAERRLRWLRKHVRPTVERLIAAGREQDVREALALL